MALRDLLILGSREKGNDSFKVGDYKSAWRWYRVSHGLARTIELSGDESAASTPQRMALIKLLNNRSIASLKLAKLFDAV